MKCKGCGATVVGKKYCNTKCKDRYWNQKSPDRHKDPQYHQKRNEQTGYADVLREKKRRRNWLDPRSWGSGFDNTSCQNEE